MLQTVRVSLDLHHVLFRCHCRPCEITCVVREVRWQQSMMEYGTHGAPPQQLCNLSSVSHPKGQEDARSPTHESTGVSHSFLVDPFKGPACVAGQHHHPSSGKEEEAACLGTTATTKTGKGQGV